MYSSKLLLDVNWLPKEADFWVKQSEDSARCLLCPWVCKITSGNIGRCGVREYRNGKLYALTYGKVSSAGPDPIEKKPLYHFYPGSSIYSIGGVGCNLGCLNCQNWNISRASVDEYLRKLTPEQVIDQSKKAGCISWAATYNEPTIWLEYVRDIAHLASENNIHSVLVTNGYITPKALKNVSNLITAANIDIKGINDDFYQDVCLVSSVNPVLKATKIMKAHNIHIELTNLVIPGKNDSDDQFDELIEWILTNLGPSIPLHFSRFFPHYKMRDIPPTPIKSLERAYQIAKEKGIHYVYLGNIPGHNGNHTYCPGCGKRLITRSGFNIKDYAITSDKKCPNCNTTILIQGSLVKEKRQTRFW